MYLSNLRSQLSLSRLERISEELLAFNERFDDWHCGLNQLKKFNAVPLKR